MQILSCCTILENELAEFLDASAVIDWAITCSMVWTSSSCQIESSPVRFLRIRHFIACLTSTVAWITVFQRSYMRRIVSLQIAGDSVVIESVVRHIASETNIFTDLKCMQLVSTSGAYYTWCDFWV